MIQSGRHEQERHMDVRNISDIAPVAEKNGTTPV